LHLRRALTVAQRFRPLGTPAELWCGNDAEGGSDHQEQCDEEFGPHRAAALLVPARMRRGSTMPFYELIARRERANLKAGKQSFDLPGGLGPTSVKAG
jgi:hypothetical protein